MTNRLHEIRSDSGNYKGWNSYVNDEKKYQDGDASRIADFIDSGEQACNGADVGSPQP